MKYRAFAVGLAAVMVVATLHLVSAPRAAAAPIDIPVTIREATGVARVGEVVTVGTPLAQSAALYSTSGLGVKDDLGQLVASQFKVTSRWGGPVTDTARPIRWLLVDFVATLGANSSKTFHVISGASSSFGNLSVSENASKIDVDTGAAAFSVSKTAYSFLDSVVVDGDEILNPSDPSNGILFKAADGTLVRSSSNGSLLSTQITDAGPAKVVVRQDWQFESANFVDERAGDWSSVYTNGVPWLYDPSEAHRYRIRVSSWSTFARDSGAVRTRIRVHNPNTCMIAFTGGASCAPQSSLNSVMFEDASLHLGLADGGASAGLKTGDGQTATLTSTASIYQESSGRDGWDYYKNLPAGETWKRYARDVTFRGYATTLGGTQIASGDQSAGWLEIGPNSDGNHASAGIAAPWKQFPVAVRASAEASPSASLELGLFPEAFPTIHTMRAGEMKTHEVSLFFGSDPTGSNARGAHAWVESPIRAVFAPNYIAETGAMPGFEPAGSESEYDLWNTTSIDKSVSQAHNSQGWWNPSSMINNADVYGHWGKDMSGYLVNDNEQRTSTDLSKYGQYRGFLRQSLRTAITDVAHSDLWWRAGVDANRATADSGFLVQPYAVQSSIWSGINFAHCFHEQAMPNDYPRGQGFGCDFAGDVGGMFELYLLTGYEPALDAANAHVNNIYSRSNPAELDYDIHDWAGPFREFASYIETLISGWEVTGDRKHLDRAVAMAQIIGSSGNTYYLDCPCAGDPAETYRGNSLFIGWLMRSLGRLAESLVVVGEEGGAGYLHVKTQLLAHAEWMVNKVMFQESHGLWTIPYYWFTNDPQGNGNDPNVDPLYSSYILMASDALALARKHGGTPTHLDAADRLFRSVVVYPFVYGWQQFTYTTINDSGKFAEFGGFFIGQFHAPLTSVTISGTATNGGSGYVSVFDAIDGQVVAYGPMNDGHWMFEVPPASCPGGYKIFFQPTTYAFQPQWLGGVDNFTAGQCAGAPSAGLDVMLPPASAIVGYAKSASNAADLGGVTLYTWRASDGAFARSTQTGPDGRYTLPLASGETYRVLAQSPTGYEDVWSNGAAGFGEASATAAPGVANFSLRGAATIEGRATRGGAGLAGTYVSAYTSCGCTTPQNVLTDASGNYSVKVVTTNASGWQYRVRFIPPTGPTAWYGGGSDFWSGALVSSPTTGVNQDVPA